jgi:hypothetical protein
MPTSQSQAEAPKPNLSCTLPPLGGTSDVGKTRTGQLNVSTANGVDRGDRLGLRVSDGGRRLQLEIPFYGAIYPWTAAALALLAGLISMSPWRSSGGLGRQRKKWLPAELTRPRRHYRIS